MADDEDDDPVVAEVDVYLAQTLANNLYLFQYPVRPADITYDNVPHIGARIKPEQQKVELELSINTSSANYYAPRGEQIAHDVDGPTPSSASEEKDSFFSSDKMDKQVLTSSLASEDVSRILWAFLEKWRKFRRDQSQRELHLTPIHGTLQLRPCFEYLNKGEANVRQASNLTEEGDSQDEEEEAKPLTVKFARPETERAKAQRLSSFKYLERKKAEEPWKTVEFYNPQDDIACAEHNLLYCQQMECESPEFRVNPRDYLKLLTPSTSQEESSKPPVQSNVLSMTQLKTMDLQDQVRALLINAKVISFSQLCRLLSPATKEASVLKCVQQYAVLVQGCWVVKSELLYPEEASVPTVELLLIFYMWRFNQSRLVMRKDIKSVTKLPSEDIKEMLDQMSRMKVTLGWEFVLPYDLEFIQKHPDVYKQQLTMWEAKYQVLQKQLNVPKQDKSGVDLKRMNSADSRVPSSPGDPLCAGVPDTLLEKAILTAGATEIDFKWPTGALSCDPPGSETFRFQKHGRLGRSVPRAVTGHVQQILGPDEERNQRQGYAAKSGSAPGRKEWMTIQQDLLERIDKKHTRWYLRGHPPC
ncbi:DNA-directed RNA polymerase III subunit RPC5 [Desmophyllum pertusum]|uniref:DNA-directed RNA polymerase III subunit RPC5 n=1 Tax=Desmophyllum pertusum TaxID=174260 RepID=A0A9W9YQ18_9CNID|nr:DNA-directed RNA polymerase III subunit RPC5 [Desmophyllum pertusum]